MVLCLVHACKPSFGGPLQATDTVLGNRMGPEIGKRLSACLDSVVLLLCQRE
jgi:hypothetical protein